MIQDIPFTGFSTVPSDFDCKDGELASSINLIYEDNALNPIHPPEELGQLPGGADARLLFIHSSNTFKHYIVLNTATHRLYWCDSQTLDAPVEIGFFDTLHHVDALGNTLVVFSTEKLNYFLFKDGAYIDLGNGLPDVQFSFGLVGHPRLYSASDKSKSTFTIDFGVEGGIKQEDLFKEFSDEVKAHITPQIMGPLNKFLRAQTVDKGRFCFPFFVRCAFRLFDGSLVCHSAPVLMNPSTMAAPIVMWKRAYRAETTDSYYTNAECDIMLVAADLDYRVLPIGDFSQLPLWSDIITSVDIFVSRPLYTYDQDGEISSLDDTDNFDTSFIGRLVANTRTGSHVLDYKPREDYPQGSVIVPPSSEDFRDHYMEWRYSNIYPLYFDPGTTTMPPHRQSFPGQSFHLPEFTDDKNRDTITQCSEFHLLRSLTIDEVMASARAGQRPIVPIPEDYLGSLAARELMEDDYLTHDRLTAASSLNYNGRLNLSGVVRRPFGGFTPNAMFAFCDRLPVSINEVDNPIYHDDSLELTIPYSADVEVSVQHSTDNLSFTVYLKEGDKVYALPASGTTAPWASPLRYPTQADAQAGVNGVPLPVSYGTYFFYPNTKATHIAVHSQCSPISTTAGTDMLIPLHPHPFLNGAYAFIGFNQVRKTEALPEAAPYPNTVPASSLISMPNKIYTSNVNNPFYFPLMGINTVGTTPVMALATAARPLSQGQFGAFPLYAFTSEGVWALTVADDGSYSARQPITRDVCINPDAITPIDSAVIFPTHRGLMLISGSEAKCISTQVNSQTPFDPATLPHFADVHASLHDIEDDCITPLPFLNFLSLASTGILYDYVHQHIIIFNPAVSYAYVYSLSSLAWGLMTSSITSAPNAYPDALAVSRSGTLLSYSTPSMRTTPVLCLSRPMRIAGGSALKTLDTAALRGRFSKGELATVLYGSRDLINWHVIASSRSHWLRGMHGTPYSFFRMAAVGSLAAGHTLTGVTYQFNPKYNNKLR